MAYPEVFLPPWVKPVSPYEPQLIDEQTVPFTPKFGRGATQRQAWGDPLWGWKLRFEAMRGDERAAMNRAVGEARGKAANVRFTPGLPQRGSFPSQELLPFGLFDSLTTSGWTTSDGTIGVSISERVTRVTRISSGSSAVGLSTGVSVSSGAAYVARAFIGRGATLVPAFNGGTLRLGGSTFNNEYGETAQIGYSAMHMLTAVSSGPTLFPSLLHYGSSTGNGSGNFFELPWLSITRCALVSSYVANEPGLLTVYKLPSSASGLLLSGDFFEINGELKRATAPLNSDSSGVGYLKFRPGMSVMPANNAPVIIGNPYGRFMAASDPRMVERFGTYADYELDLIEVY